MLVILVAMNLFRAVLSLVPPIHKQASASETDDSLIRISRQRITYLLEEHWRKRSSLRSLDFPVERRRSRIHSLGATETCNVTDLKRKRIGSRPSLPYVFDQRQDHSALNEVHCWTLKFIVSRPPKPPFLQKPVDSSFLDGLDYEEIMSARVIMKSRANPDLTLIWNFLFQDTTITTSVVNV